MPSWLVSLILNYVVKNLEENIEKWAKQLRQIVFGYLNTQLEKMLTEWEKHVKETSDKWDDGLPNAVRLFVKYFTEK